MTDRFINIEPIPVWPTTLYFINFFYCGIGSNEQTYRLVANDTNGVINVLLALGGWGRYGPPVSVR